MNIPEARMDTHLSPNHYQRSLIPLTLTDIYDSNLASADLKYIGTAANGKDYALKCIGEGQGYVPAAELFCYELARDLDIPTPDYQLIEMPNKTLAFGSTWEGGVLAIDQEIQMIEILTGIKPVRNLKLFLSKIYAMDVFVNNVDRHFGNYLFRQSFQSLIILAFDYGRAWHAYHSPYTKECLSLISNTQQTLTHIKCYGQYDTNTALQTLDKISSIPRERIDNILRSIPDSWLPHPEAEKFCKWWGTSEMADRINSLKESIQNGMV